jgi:hypothetical protein
MQVSVGTFVYQVHSHEEMSQAYRYLANYHWQKRELDDAYAAAQKCAEYTEVGIIQSTLS